MPTSQMPTSQPDREPAYRQPGTILRDRSFTVPLDHARPDGEQIEVFAREVTSAAKEAEDLPWLVYLQGGPGFGAPRPSGREGWLDRALNDFRVLLLDQRGTGRSTPATRQTLARLGSPRAQADYLAHFRADSIVADAEMIRPQVTGGDRWSVLGQSFGGFCTVTYLSQAPEGVREAFITGGLPGLSASADEVYRATYRMVAQKNAEHYRRYPGDAEQARRVAGILAREPVRLPGGGLLTVEAFQALGHGLGMSTGSDQLHYLLEDPFAGGELSDAFLSEAQSRLSFAAAPMYAVLHEACYAQAAATRWAASRVREEFGDFTAVSSLTTGVPVLFTGEMIYPWMFETDPALAPLAGAAELLAAKDDWPPLYDQARLAANEVPVAAAIYYEDMYVPAELSIPTARAIDGLRAWITNEYQHDGLRVSSGAVLDRLIGMARGLV